LVTLYGKYNYFFDKSDDFFDKLQVKAKIFLKKIVQILRKPAILSILTPTNVVNGKNPKKANFLQ